MFADTFELFDQSQEELFTEKTQNGWNNKKQKICLSLLGIHPTMRCKKVKMTITKIVHTQQ